MLKGVRQAIGNVLNNVFEERKWPLDDREHYGPIYRFFNPLQNEVYEEIHKLVNQEHANENELANINARLAELKKRKEGVALGTLEFKNQLKEEEEKDNSPREGDSSYAKFRKEQSRNQEGRRRSGKET